jgi:hypothetical protein
LADLRDAKDGDAASLEFRDGELDGVLGNSIMLSLDHEKIYKDEVVVTNRPFVSEDSLKNEYASKVSEAAVYCVRMGRSATRRNE